MTISDEHLERVYAYWDTLYEHDTSASEQVRQKMLTGLDTLLSGVSNAAWTASVREQAPDGNPLGGWRVRLVQFLHSPPVPDLATRHVQKARREPNEATRLGFANAGQHRAYRLCDLVPRSWYATDYRRRFYAEAGFHDALFVAHPTSQDVEVCICLYRDDTQPAFTVEDRELTAFALRGLRWLHVQQLLSAGLLVARAPLSPTETKVLQGLLAGHSAKEICTELEHSLHTTHEYVRRIYAKYGVSNRAALLALWLGRRPSPAAAAAPSSRAPSRDDA